MAATSINIQPIKGGSEAHNYRTKDLAYVRKDLSDKNESYSIDTVENRLATIKRTYRENTGQKMQKKATPIREGVVVIDRSTTMKQLRNFADKCEKRFGIKAFQIHMHKDEGHHNSKEWKENLHAHIVYDWTNEKGKSIKLNRQDMDEMQTMLSESLKMEQGVSSDKKHLSAIQFKNQAEEQRAQELEKTLKELRKQVTVIKTQKNGAKMLSKASEKIGDMFGKTKNDEEKEALKKALNDEKGNNRVLENRVKMRDQEIEKWKFQEKKWQYRDGLKDKELKEANSYFKASQTLLNRVIGESKKFLRVDERTPEQLEYVKKTMPSTFNLIKESEQDQARNQNRNRGRKLS